MMQEQKPTYFVKKFNFNFPHRTQLSSENVLRTSETATSDLRKFGFINRTTLDWNRLPLELKKETSLVKFNKELKVHIKETI